MRLSSLKYQIYPLVTSFFFLFLPLSQTSNLCSLFPQIYIWIPSFSNCDRGIVGRDRCEIPGRIRATLKSLNHLVYLFYFKGKRGDRIENFNGYQKWSTEH